MCPANNKRCPQQHNNTSVELAATGKCWDVFRGAAPQMFLATPHPKNASLKQEPLQIQLTHKVTKGSIGTDPQQTRSLSVCHQRCSSMLLCSAR
jgi:hypothetical protein